MVLKNGITNDYINTVNKENISYTNDSDNDDNTIDNISEDIAEEQYMLDECNKIYDICDLSNDLKNYCDFQCIPLCEKLTIKKMIDFIENFELL